MDVKRPLQCTAAAITVECAGRSSAILAHRTTLTARSSTFKGWCDRAGCVMTSFLSEQSVKIDSADESSTGLVPVVVAT
jgi:hypothetical protein